MPKKIKKQYVPKTDAQKIAYLMGEAGEVIAECARLVRFGLDNYNPELPPSQRETNRDAALRELVDLERGIAYAREVLDDGGFERRKKARQRLGRAMVGPVRPPRKTLT